MTTSPEGSIGDRDFLRDGAFIREEGEEDMLPRRSSSEEDSVRMVDVLPDDYVDQLLGLIPPVSASVSNEHHADEELDSILLREFYDLPSLPVSPLPPDHDMDQDHNGKDSSDASDEQSVLTQLSLESNVVIPPVVAATGQTKCDCEGCNMTIDKRCGACAKCLRGSLFLCYCACCSYQPSHKLQEAIEQLTIAKTNHTPDYKPKDIVSCKTKGTWHVGRITCMIVDSETTNYKVRLDVNGKTIRCGEERLMDPFLCQVSKHIYRLEIQRLERRWEQQEELGLLVPAEASQPKRSSRKSTSGRPTRSRAMEVTSSSALQSSSPSPRRKRQKAAEPRLSQQYSSTLDLGDSVLAPFLTENGTHRYWGIVIKVPSDEDDSYHVWYDDDDFRVDLKKSDLWSEAEVERRMPERLLDQRRTKWKLPKVRTLEDLYENSCGVCNQCRTKVPRDCHCRGCRWNKVNPNCRKKACLLRFCCGKSNGRFQPMPDLFPSSWRFCFTKRHSTRQRNCLYDLCFCGAIDDIDLQLMRGLNPKPWHCLSEALHSSSYGNKEAQEALETFYDDVLGMTLTRVSENHPYVGKPWLQRWSDLEHKENVVHGTVKSCESHVDFTRQGGVGRMFTIELENGPEHIVFEDYALGGIIAAGAPSCPLPYSVWHVPHNMTVQWRRCDQRPSLQFEYRGHRFELANRESRKPHDSLGLFLKCFACNETCGDGLKLRPGELIDLGVFGPQREADIVSRLRHDTKCFLFDGKPRTWEFDAIRRPGGPDYVIDLTEDLTGELHDKAAQSIIVFVTESDGRELPTVVSDYDPTGAMHILLGRREAECIIPVGGDEIELKIDYGESFEPRRVKNGCPRVKGQKLAELQEKVAKEDSDFIASFEEYSNEALDDSIEYLLQFRELEGGEIPEETYRRLLLLSIISRHKLEARSGLSSASFLSNVNSIVAEDPLLIGVDQLIAKLCDRFLRNPSEIKTQILAFDELRQKVESLFCRNSVCVQDLDGEDLFHMIKMDGKKPARRFRHQVAI